jgi:hypothetical protein
MDKEFFSDDEWNNPADGPNGYANGQHADDPLPLFPPLLPAAPYPLDALGPVLAPVAAAIARKVQVPDAMAAQSVLAVASLATSFHADILLPYGQTRPLSLFCLTAAESGDRKSTADREALWPIEKWERVLKEKYDEDMNAWRIEHAAWTAEKRKIEADRKIDLLGRREGIARLGPEPERPLEPLLVSGDLTMEGLTKSWTGMHPSLGIFSAEGGMFTAGHAMRDDSRLYSAATLSGLWDGQPVRRIRAMDGVSMLRGRRLSMHLMFGQHS